MTAPLARVEAASRPVLPFRWAHQVIFDPTSAQEIVEDIFIAGGMSVTYGESNSGKTTLMADLAFRMPTGQPWLGKRTQRGGVVYVAAESPVSVERRLEAYRRTHGTEVGAFGIVSTSLCLMDPSADVDDLVELIVSQGNKLPAGPIALVIVDTMARVMTGANENAGEDMSRLIAAGDRIREETGAHVNWVHHSGKDRALGARGHSSLRAAVDTELEVTRDPSTKVHLLTVTKQRDLGSGGESLSARFVPVELGSNQWGRPITSCVVEQDDPASETLQAMVRSVDHRHAEEVVLAGFKRLLEQGVRATDGESSPDYLPKRLLEKGLGNTYERKALAAAMHRLMTGSKLRREQVGKYANGSTPKMGLVLVP